MSRPNIKHMLFAMGIANLLSIAGIVLTGTQEQPLLYLSISAVLHLIAVILANWLNVRED